MVFKKLTRSQMDERENCIEALKTSCKAMEAARQRAQNFIDEIKERVDNEISELDEAGEDTSEYEDWKSELETELTDVPDYMYEFQSIRTALKMVAV